MTLTSRERILRTIRRQEVDHIPIADKPWGSDTVDRWVADGMPADADYQDYFGFDKMIRFATDHSIPTNVSVADLQHILAVVREVGQY